MIEKNTNDIHKLCVNTIRTLSMDAVQKANSGHPGAPMGLAPAGYVLFTRILKHNPQNPKWQDRDRFVLSGGHASMLIYSLLYLCGYGLTLDDLKQFRQMESKTPGHPEFEVTPGIETSTGPLGQGFANAVGMAIAERHLGSLFNKPDHTLIDHYTYVFCGDGDMMEGITSEAASLAGHLGLSRLICIYDDNRISIEGCTDITFTEDVAKRFEAYDWHVQRVTDGNDLDAIENALKAAKANTSQPSLILLRTHIAYGSPNKQDNCEAHGSPLGDKEIKLTKEALGWPQDKSFYVPEEVLTAFETMMQQSEIQEKQWQKALRAYSENYPELIRQWQNFLTGHLPDDWENSIPVFKLNQPAIATRVASGKILNALCKTVPNFIGGSADLAPSNKTYLEKSNDFQKQNYSGKNIRFGVREHAMGAILSGICLHGGLRPYGGTFLVFSDYMRPAIRVACLMKLPVIYIFTHDSIAVGEDGPTHQPIEHLAALRLIPGLITLRPADAEETADAWRYAIKSAKQPVAIILSRQDLPILDRSKAIGAFSAGAYIIHEPEKMPNMIMIATGSEVHLALNAAETLAKNNIHARVVSMPSWELFEKSPMVYRDQILPPSIKTRLVIEAGHPMGWERYSGDQGYIHGIKRFGCSAPGSVVMKAFGFTPDDIVQKAKELLSVMG
ncbi:MAG: transketolase [Desulfobacterales bacterium]|nr:transketolase [Desulfobacterales bacterium]